MGNIQVVSYITGTWLPGNTRSRREEEKWNHLSGARPGREELEENDGGMENKERERACQGRLRELSSRVDLLSFLSSEPTDKPVCVCVCVCVCWGGGDLFREWGRESHAS